MDNVTIADVAKHAGVGVGTVSRVLNNSGNVSAEMRERILASAKELNYVPNPIARRLKATKTMNIAYVTTSIDNVTFSDIVRGVNSVIAPEGYTLFLVETGFDSEVEKSLVESLVHQYVDGIILVSSVVEDNEKTHAYIQGLSNLRKRDKRIPVVQIAVPPLNPNVDSVTFDDKYCAYRAVMHLIEIGRKDIAYISVAKQSGVYRPRLEGYLMAMREAGLSDRTRIVEGGFTFHSGYEAMSRLLNQHEELDAVFTGCDGVAIGLLAACRDFGLKVPDDIAVIGIDDANESMFVDPKLSTIRVPRVRMGRVAGELLLKRIAEGNESYEAEHILLDTEILIRESTLKSAANKRRFPAS